MAAVGVLGLGRLGLPLALTLDAVGHQVHVWDTSEEARQVLHRRSYHGNEPGIEELLRDHVIDLTAPRAMAELCEIVFLAVPGSWVQLTTALRGLQADKPRTDPPIIAIAATVAVGTCQLLACQDATAGLTLVYTPLRTEPDSVVHDLRHPELQIVGATPDTKHQAARVLAVLRTLQRQAVMELIGPTSAELAALAIPVFAALKRSFANEVAVISGLRAADVNEVLGAVALPRHVGHHGLTAGGAPDGPYLSGHLDAWGEAGGQLHDAIDKVNWRTLGWIRTQVDILTPQPFTVLGRATWDGQFSAALTGELREYGWSEVPAPEADVVILAQPLRGHDLCGKLKLGATVLDYWRTHTYLRACGYDWRGFGLPLGSEDK